MGLPTGWVFFYERVTNFTSGVSPLLPVILLSLGFFWWGYARLNCLFLLDCYSVPCPFPQTPDTEPSTPALIGTGEFRVLNREHARLMSGLESPQRAIWGKASFVLWLALFFVFCRLARRFVPTIEGPLFDSIILLGLMSLAALLVYALCTLLWLWKGIRQILCAIARLPMRKAYDRLPARTTASFGPYLSSGRPGREANLADRRREQQLLLQKYATLKQKEAFPWKAALPEQIPHADLDALQDHPLPPDAPPEEVHASLTKTARACVCALQYFWKDLPLGEALADPPVSATTETAPVSHDSHLQGWRALAEDFVALEVVTYLSQFFIQLRNLLQFLTGVSLLLLFAVTTYPLQPARLWLIFAGGVILTVAGIAITMFVQIERDDVVSRISGSTPNQVDWLHGSLLTNLLTYAVPLLALLAAASTDMSDLVHAWVDPLLHAFR